MVRARMRMNCFFIESRRPALARGWLRRSRM
jgi:hypothetical protein